MTVDVFKHALDAIKLAPRYLVAVAVVLGFLLFAPTELAQRFGVSDVAKDHRQWIGIGLLACVALLLVGVAGAIYRAINTGIRKWRFKRQLLERLHRLTEDEKQILRFYIAHQTRSNTLRVDDGVVQGLAGSGVIYRSSNMGSLVEGFAYNLSEVAWQELNEEPTLLNGSTNLYRTDRQDYGF